MAEFTWHALGWQPLRGLGRPNVETILCRTTKGAESGKDGMRYAYRPHTTMIAVCACGSVEIEAAGAPIVTVVCYCDDCQEGARRIEALPEAARILDAAGGSAYVAYRRDRVTCTKGAALLKPHKLRATSATNRVVATCCNSAMLLNFDDWKHWLDIYRERIRGPAPPVQMHLCTRFARSVNDAPHDAPRYQGYPLKLVAKLIKARLAMSFARGRRVRHAS